MSSAPGGTWPSRWPRSLCRGRCSRRSWDGVYSQGGFPAYTSKINPDPGGNSLLNDHSDERLRTSLREVHNGRSAATDCKRRLFSPLTPRGWLPGNGRNGAAGPIPKAKTERLLRVVSRHPGLGIARVRLRWLGQVAGCRQLAPKRRLLELADWSACWGETDAS